MRWPGCGSCSRPNLSRTAVCRSRRAAGDLGARPARSPTPRARSRCTTSTSRCRRACTGSRGPHRPASRRWLRCCPGPSTRRAAPCCSVASTCSISICRRCAPRSAWSPSGPTSSPRRSPRTSRFSPTCRGSASSRPSRTLGLDRVGRGLPDGLDTVLGPGGTPLSAGEEQLVAFARLLVRDVQVVVLDEATARMDPVTEARVVQAADRLLTRPHGVVVAHRLSTTARADSRLCSTPAASCSRARGGARRTARARSVTCSTAAGRGCWPTGAAFTRHLLGTRARRARRHLWSTLVGVRQRARACPRTRGAGHPPGWACLAAPGCSSSRRCSAPSARSPAYVWGRLVERPAARPARRSRTRCRPCRKPARRAAAAGRRHPVYPAVVGGGDAARPALGPRRSDHAAPLAPHAARRGGRPRHGCRPLRSLRRPVGRLHQRSAHRGRHGRRGAERAGRCSAARRHGAVGRCIGVRLTARRSVRCCLLDRAGRVRPGVGLCPRLCTDDQACRGDPERAPAPAGGRRRTRRGRRLRAPRAGGARRRTDRARAVRRRGRLAHAPGGWLGSRDRAARDDGRQRLRLVRPGRGRGHHRSARRPRVVAGRPPVSPAVPT